MILGILAAVILGAAMGSAVPQWAIVGIILVGYVFMVAGTWFLTSPDPSGLGEDKYGTSRRLIRITLGIGVLNQVLDIVRNSEIFPPAVNLALTVIGGLAAICALIGFVAQLIYLGKLASRIPDPALTARARFLAPAMGICYGLIVVLGIVIVFAARQGPRTANSAVAGVGCFAGIMGLLLLIFFILYLRLLERIGGRFKEAAAFARQTWAAQQRAPI